MKSKLFKDTQGLDQPFDLCAPDKVSVCLRLSKQAYDAALERSQSLRMTSGDYIEALILRDREKDERRLM